MSNKSIEETITTGLTEEYKIELYTEAMENGYTRDEASVYADDWVRSKKGREVINNDAKNKLEPYKTIDSKFAELIDRQDRIRNEIICEIKGNSSKKWAIFLNLIAAALVVIFGPFILEGLKFSLNYNDSMEHIYSNYERKTDPETKVIIDTKNRSK